MEMQDMISSIQSVGKLKKLRICLIKPYSSLSKAFSRSILNTMRPHLLFEMDMVRMSS